MTKYVYTSVVSEYQKVGLNFKELLSNPELLDSELRKVAEASREMEEKLSAAEICSKIPNMDNNSIIRLNDISNNGVILESIRMEAVSARYKLALLKIVKLLSNKEDDYDRAKAKREDLLDLIKYIVVCLEQFGVKFKINPFPVVKVKGQLEAINQIGDNSRTISNIRKRINTLNIRTEEMIGQNVLLLAQINDIKPILHDNLSIGSIIDKSGVEVHVEEKVEKEVLPNQVIGVSLLPATFLLARAIEKAKAVVKRVYKMLTVEEVEVIKTDVVPELVIEAKEEPVSIKADKAIFEDSDIEEDYLVDISDNTSNEEIVSSDLFEEVKPFEDAPLFVDRLDDDLFTNVASADSFDTTPVINPVFNQEEIKFEPSTDTSSEQIFEDEVEMPDAFWVTQEDTNREEEKIISFDEQISRLLGEDKPKTRTKAA